MKSIEERIKRLEKAIVAIDKISEIENDCRYQNFYKELIEIAEEIKTEHEPTEYEIETKVEGFMKGFPGSYIESSTTQKRYSDKCKHCGVELVVDQWKAK